MNTQDTIAAIITGYGTGPVGIIRLSGPESLSIASQITDLTKEKLKPHMLRLGYIVEHINKQKIDQVLVSYMPSPNSFTGEDIIEINCHGGIVVINKILEQIISCGARHAAPGEFSKRAFLNGKIDLSQAEAIMDLVSAKTSKGASIALNQLEGKLSAPIKAIRINLLNILSEIEALIDFPEDMGDQSKGVIGSTINDAIDHISELLDNAGEGQIYRNGIAISIIGRPNVGKSSLLNYFLGTKRAIVSNIPGTTRDTIEESCNLDGIPLKIVDTAGIREITHEVEVEGIKRSHEALKEADIVLFVRDINSPLDDEEQELIKLVKDNNQNYLIIENKIDLAGQITSENLNAIRISLKTKDGLEKMKEALISLIKKDLHSTSDSNPVISNQRHIESLIKSKESLLRVKESLEMDMPTDFLSIDLRDSVTSLGEITGEDIADEIIDNIFSSFCIGK